MKIEQVILQYEIIDRKNELVELNIKMRVTPTKGPSKALGYNITIDLGHFVSAFDCIFDDIKTNIEKAVVEAEKDYQS